jgi:hypothetical protein
MFTQNHYFLRTVAQTSMVLSILPSKTPYAISILAFVRVNKQLVRRTTFLDRTLQERLARE